MKKSIIAIIVTIVIIAAICFIFFMNQPKTPSPSTTGTKTDTEITLNNISNNQTQNANETKEEKVVPAIKETEIAKFSTEIFIDDENRDTNLELTASKINGTIVKNNETFSFNETVGNPTPERGYEKAGIIVDGKKEKGYGGGNCQVSTTLYDAVLKVEGLEVTERHEHGKNVGYVEKGKDATVVYDELDLKFKNNTGYDIKLVMDVTEEKVTAKIMKLTES